MTSNNTPDFNYFILPGSSAEFEPKITISNPNIEEYNKLGQIFIYQEYKNTNPKNQEIADLLVSTISHTFYAQPEGTDMELAFENTLAITNKEIQKIIVDLPQEWLASINILIGAVKGNNFVFTSVGKVNTFLTIKDKITNISENETAVPNPLKLFTNISNGQLPNSGKVFVCNENILDYFSLEKIRKTITDNDPAETLGFFQNLLEEQNAALHFATILFSPAKEHAQVYNQKTRVTKTEQIQQSINEAVNSDDDSMSALIQKESKTKEYLAPSYWPSVKKKLNEYIQKYKSKKGAQDNSFSSLKNQDEKIRNEAPTTTPIKKNYFIIILGFLGNLLGQIISLFKRNKPTNIKKSFSGLPNKTNSFIGNAIEKIKKMSSARKILLILAIILIILFVWSITGIGQRRENSIQETNIEENLSTIDVKINEAKAALLYENEEGSRELLVEASSLLDEIPDTKKYAETKATKQASIDEQYKAISHVITISDPTVITDFSDLSSSNPISNIFRLDQTFYAFNTNNDSVYSVELSDKSKSQVVDSSDGSKILAIDDISDNRLALLYADDRFKQLNTTDNSLSDLSIDFSNQDKNVVDINVFSNRIYTLDPLNKQIFKHTKSGESYTTGENWLSTGIDKMQNAASLAIDGSIYILFNDGTVDKYTAGQKEVNFKAPSLDPSLENATKIYTDETLDNIYILDPNNKRFIVMDKSGNLINQYFSDNFESLTDFSIDEQNKTVYLVSGTRLMSIEIEL